MVHYRRNKYKGATYFFTVTLKDRKSSLLTSHIDILKHAMRKVIKRYPYKTIAMVILPDHIHAIWQLPANDSDYSKRWQHIKSFFTQRVIASGLPFKKDKRGEYDIWQRRFWEHTIRDEKDMKHHIDYIHNNPVKHGWVERVEDWPFSSFHKYKRDELPQLAVNDKNLVKAG